MSYLNFNISFGKSRTSDYTPHQIKVMREMKKAAIENKWCDIYTGKPFTKTNPPTIEHIIAHCIKNTKEGKILAQSGFQIDGLDNIFPVGSLGNSKRSNKSFKKCILEDPKILDRLLQELDKYKKYNSDLIKGEVWVDKLQKTLCKELSGVCSDVKTKKLCLNG